MKVRLILIMSLAAVAAILLFFAQDRDQQNKNFDGKVEINGHFIKILIADTEPERTIGLGNRDSLKKGEGMFFIFDYDDNFGIWMKDMRFPIDIVWIGSDGNVVDFEENVLPSTYPKIFSPKFPARYVLELPAGSVKAFKIEIGDIVRH